MEIQGHDTSFYISLVQHRYDVNIDSSCLAPYWVSSQIGDMFSLHDVGKCPFICTVKSVWKNHLQCQDFFETGDLLRKPKITWTQMVGRNLHQLENGLSRQSVILRGILVNGRNIEYSPIPHQRPSGARGLQDVSHWRPTNFTFRMRP